MQDTLNKTHKKRDRLAEMWEDLLANPVAPEPPAKERMALGARPEADHPVSRLFAPALEPSALWSVQAIESETSVVARTDSAQKEERVESILLKGRDNEPDRFPPAPVNPPKPVRPTWRDSLQTFFSTLVEPVNTDPALLLLEVENSDSEAPASMTLKTAHEESLSFSSPFRWEPKPAWINTPVQSSPRSPGVTDVQRLAFRPKIPLRPLHKQRFYRRLFFYLRGWLSRSFRKTV